MHKVRLSPEVFERSRKNRRGLHAYADLNPRQTALLVVDLQRAYLDKSLDYSFCQHAVDIVPNVNRLAKTLRRAGGLVVWIQNTATAETLQNWSNYNYRLLSEAKRRKRYESIEEGAAGHELWPELDVQPGDLRIKKTRFSAFITGSSHIDQELRQRSIDTVIVTGTGTGTCCESTARDAMMLNYATIMASDANACASDEEHNASLTAFYRNFGDVMTTEELVRCIAQNEISKQSDALPP
jgi:ureidoacrylate peracid hydrolase